MKSKLEIVKYDLEGLVAEQIPNYKSFSQDKKFRVKCPFCEEGKTPALSILRNLKVGICFRCEKLFVNDSNLETFDTKSDFISDLISLHSDKESLCAINNSIFDLFSDIDHNEFLEKRNPFVKDWNYYGIKQGENEVITPYYLFGELVYFQIRKYNPRGFYNPKNVSAPLFIPSGVKAKGRWYQDCPTVLVEGPFDAIAIDTVRQYSNKKFNIAALGGKVMTELRSSLLKQLGVTNIVIFLDESVLSEDLSKDMRENYGFRNVSVIPSSGPDPEEVEREMGLEKFSDFVLSYVFKDNTFKDNKYFIPNNSFLDEEFKIDFKRV